MISRQVKRAGMRADKSAKKKAAQAAAKGAISKAAGELQQTLQLHKEQIDNLQAFAMQQLRNTKEQADYLNHVANITVSLIKEALGRDLSEADVKQLTEALDGPEKTNEQTTPGQDPSNVPPATEPSVSSEAPAAE